MSKKRTMRLTDAEILQGKQRLRDDMELARHELVVVSTDTGKSADTRASKLFMVLYITYDDDNNPHIAKLCPSLLYELGFSNSNASYGDIGLFYCGAYNTSREHEIVHNISQWLYNGDYKKLKLAYTW